MKALWREVAVIVGAAAVVGLVYNTLNPRGIPLVRREQRLPVVDDTTFQRELQELARQDANSAERGDTVVASQATVTGSPLRLPSSEKSQAVSPPHAKADTVASEAEENVIRAVRYEHVLQLLKHPEILVIDARRPEDYAAGHIPGARNIFAYDFTAHIPELVGLPRTKPIVIYCDGGQCELSHFLAEQLRALGFRRLYIYEGGWEEWRRRHSE